MNSDEILIIQCQIPMKPQKFDIFREQILKQKASGVILLPPYCTVITKPKDIQVEVEKEDTACLKWLNLDGTSAAVFDDIPVTGEELIPYEKLNVGDTFKLFKSGDKRVFRKEKEGAIQIRDSSGNPCEKEGFKIYLYIGCRVYKEG
ncbi:MAG: hypothetical protein J6Y02_12785 [Pseudobutyrivibrio sp.]|nr:hypothetical protein [Pseudobutyrivibrio sp.]